MSRRLLRFYYLLRLGFVRPRVGDRLVITVSFMFLSLALEEL
jgi:hypothetical protein